VNSEKLRVKESPAAKVFVINRSIADYADDADFFHFAKNIPTSIIREHNKYFFVKGLNCANKISKT
jgi:hypothetical protein